MTGRAAGGPARPRPSAWFQLHEARTGRYVGMFLDLPDARRWIVRRPPDERYRLVLYFRGRVVARFRCRSAFGGQVKGITDFIGEGGSDHGEGT